jgi:hypothetical protein
VPTGVKLGEDGVLMRAIFALAALLMKILQDPDAIAFMLLDLAELNPRWRLRGIKDRNVLLDLNADGEIILASKKFGNRQRSPPLLKGETQAGVDAILLVYWAVTEHDIQAVLTILRSPR